MSGPCLVLWARLPEAFLKDLPKGKQGGELVPKDYSLAPAAVPRSRGIQRVLPNCLLGPKRISRFPGGDPSSDHPRKGHRPMPGLAFSSAQQTPGPTMVRSTSRGPRLGPAAARNPAGPEKQPPTNGLILPRWIRPLSGRGWVNRAFCAE